MSAEDVVTAAALMAFTVAIMIGIVGLLIVRGIYMVWRALRAVCEALSRVVRL